MTDALVRCEEHRGLDHRGVMRNCIQEIHFCWGADDGFAYERAWIERGKIGVARVGGLRHATQEVSPVQPHLTICAADGCERTDQRRVRGLCIKHYGRIWRAADFVSLRPKPSDDANTRRQMAIARFWTKVHKTEDCWFWLGARDRDGYGQFHPTGRPGVMVKAHRFAYELTVGRIPVGFLVCHHCDNPPCVRPDHLFAGTNRDNLSDMARKGRSTRGRPRGW